MSAAACFVVGWINIAFVVYWLLQGEPALSAFAGLGALCAFTAFKWARG